MDKYSFSKLKNENDNCLKTEKDMIELQKTIIFYGEKIISELENLKILLNKSTSHKEKSKETIDFSTNTQDCLLQQLLSLKIPKGYKDY